MIIKGIAEFLLARAPPLFRSITNLIIAILASKIFKEINRIIRAMIPGNIINNFSHSKLVEARNCFTYSFIQILSILNSISQFKFNLSLFLELSTKMLSFYNNQHSFNIIRLMIYSGFENYHDDSIKECLDFQYILQIFYTQNYITLYIDHFILLYAQFIIEF